MHLNNFGQSCVKACERRVMRPHEENRLVRLLKRNTFNDGQKDTFK